MIKRLLTLFLFAGGVGLAACSPAASSSPALQTTPLGSELPSTTLPSSSP
jgi:hypothetical protein